METTTTTKGHSMNAETITEARVRVLINDSFHTRDEEGTLNGPVLRFSEMSRDQIDAEMNKGGANVMTTRMFTHTGPRRGDVFSESTFAKQIAMIEAGLQEPTIYVGNLQSLRTYADVRDAVKAYYMLVTRS